LDNHKIIISYKIKLKILADDIFGYAQISMYGQPEAYRITDQGVLQITQNKHLCFFNQFKYPMELFNGLTAFEESTSTLIHCGGVQVFDSFLIQSKSVKKLRKWS